MSVFFLVVAGLNLALGFAIAWFLAPEARVQIVYLPAPTPPAPMAPEVAEAPAAAPPAESPGPASEPAPAVEATLPGVGTTIVDFKRELMRYRDQLASLDQRMRANSETRDAAAIQRCLIDLRSANDQYLQQQSSTSDRLRSDCVAPELAPINRQLEVALNRQADEVNRSNTQLADAELEDDLLASCQTMLGETSRLVDANHTMRDALQDVELQLTRRTQPLAAADSANTRSSQGNLMSRTQLEAVLAQWWQADPEHSRPLSVGLIDLDRFRELNEAQGLVVGDRVLDAVGQLVGDCASGNRRAARMSAQKFLLMFPDLPAREATEAIERVRQQVESTQFKRDEASVAVTVSCAVVQATADDTLTALLDRVEATLQEAKRYGRNRTFLHDGKFPAPVVPPVLTIENRIFAI